MENDNVVYAIAGSMVMYNTSEEVWRRAIESFLDTSLSVKLVIVDNSPDDRKQVMPVDARIEYISSPENVGFGAGNNIALRRMAGRSKYTLVLNPDVFFEKGTLEALYTFMETQVDVGLVMPKVLYPDGSLQYLCRLLPTPLDMIARKVKNPLLSRLLQKGKDRYELRCADYGKAMNVPYLSGCFMFLRSDILEKVGLFDENFFLYFEDVDLSRRIHEHYRTHYYPDVTVYHNYARGSESDSGHFKHLVSSGITYFNKWGWFFDAKRKSANQRTLQSLSS